MSRWTGGPDTRMPAFFFDFTAIHSPSRNRPVLSFLTPQRSLPDASRMPLLIFLPARCCCLPCGSVVFVQVFFFTCRSRSASSDPPLLAKPSAKSGSKMMIPPPLFCYSHDSLIPLFPPISSLFFVSPFFSGLCVLGVWRISSGISWHLCRRCIVVLSIPR